MVEAVVLTVTFSTYLGVVYNNYVLGNIMIIGKSNKQIVKVIRKSKLAGTRYTGKELVPSDKIPGWALSGKRDYRNQMKKMILEQKYQNDDLSETVLEYIDNINQTHN